MPSTPTPQPASTPPVDIGDDHGDAATAEALWHAFFELNQISDVQTDGEGSCALRLNDLRTVARCQAADGLLVVQVHIAALPQAADRRGALALALLTRATDLIEGDVVGIDAVEDVAVYQRTLALDGLDAATLTRELWDNRLVLLVNRGAVDAGNDQAIANTLNGLKAALEQGVLFPRLPALVDAFVRLAGLINQGKVDHSPVLHVANLFNALKAALDHGLVSGSHAGVSQAFTRLVRMVDRGLTARGKPQEIANLFNGLKAALDHGLLACRHPDLVSAFTCLVAEVNQGKVDAGHPHAIANAFNGLRAALDHGVLSSEDPVLVNGFARLMGLVNQGRMDTGSAQQVAAIFNGLKSALESKPPVLTSEDADLVSAFIRAVGLINQGRMDGGDAQTMANAFTGLKVALLGRPPVLTGDSPGLRDACARLIRLIVDGRADNANAQHIANIFHGLRAALRVMPPAVDSDTPGVAEAFLRLNRLVTSGVLDDTTLDQCAKVQAGLQAALRYDVLSRDQPELVEAVAVTWAAQRAARDAKRFIGHEAWDLSHAMSSTAGLLALNAGNRAVGLGLLTSGLTRLFQLPFEAALPNLYVYLPRDLGNLYRLLTRKPPAAPGSNDMQAALRALREDRNQLMAVMQAWAAWVGVATRAPADAQRIDLVTRAATLVDDILQREKRFKVRDKERLAWRQTLDKHIRAWIDWLIDARRQAQAQPLADAGTLISSSPLEQRIFQRYRPDLDILPPYPALTPPQQRALLLAAHGRLALPRPVPMDGDARGAIDLPVINARGQLIGHERRTASIYQELFGLDAGLPPPVIMKLHMGLKPDELPSIALVEGHWYRFDVFGGSRLKPDLAERNPGVLIGIPIEASDFFGRQWLTSVEAYCYAQRAFLPEEAAYQPLSDGPETRPVPAVCGLKGAFALRLLPDGDPTQAQVLFDPRSPWAALRTQDGFGFIRSDLADGLRLPAVDPTLRLPARCSAQLSYQALQYYPDPATLSPPQPALQQQLMDQSRALATQKLQPLVDHWDVTTLMAAPSYARYYTLVHGAPPACAPTVVPSNGSTVLLPDTPEWRAVGKDGLIVGRNPYDTTNLRVVPLDEIGYSPVLAEHTALQYTLTGHALDEDKNPQTHFFKGLLMVVPMDQWPAAHADQQILLSSKDQKMCSLWNDADTKKAAQTSVATLALHGCLVIKEVRSHVMGAHYGGLMESLAGDYDGDRLDLIPCAPVSALARLVAATPKLDNPKMPKAFTPRTRPGNGQKMMELRLQLLQDWVTIGGMYCAAPAAVQRQIDDALAPDHALDEVLGENDWWGTLGLADPQPVFAAAVGTYDEDHPMSAYVRSLLPDQRARIMRTEIAIGIKAGTDAEKTTVPVSALKARARQVRKAMREQFGLVSVPYGKGLRRKLESVYVADDPLDTLVRVLEDRLGLATPQQPLQSLPQLLMQDIGHRFLADVGGRGHLGGVDLEHTCRILARLPALQNNAYVDRKLTIIEQALTLPDRLSDETLRWPHLVPVVRWMASPSGSRPGSVKVQVALLGRTARLRLADGVGEAPLRRAMAEIIALAFDSLAAPNRLTGPWATLVQQMARDADCLAQCPSLRDLSRGNVLSWSTALLALLALNRVAPVAVPDIPDTFEMDLSRCSESLGTRVMAALASTGCKGTLRLRVAALSRQPLQAAIEQHRTEWQKAGLAMVLVVARTTASA